MNQPQVSIFPAEMTTALYRRAIASAWRQKALTAPPVLTVRGCEVMAELYRTLPAAFDDFCSTGVSLYQGEV